MTLRLAVALFTVTSFGALVAIPGAMASTPTPVKAKFSQAVLEKQKSLNAKLHQKFPNRVVLLEDGIEGPATKAAEKALDEAK